MESSASPDGGISNRVSLSGTKRPRERSDSTDEDNEATATTTKCPIFSGYDGMYVTSSEAMVHKFEEKYKLLLDECNNDLECQRKALTIAMHCHQKNSDLETSEIEGYYIPSLDRHLLETHDKLEQEVKELKNRLNTIEMLAEQHDDTLEKQLEETAKQLDEMTKKHNATINHLTKNLDETAKQRDVSTKNLDDTAKQLDEAMTKLDETAKQRDVSTKNLDEMTRVNESLTNELCKTKKQLESMTEERDETSKELDKTTTEVNKTKMELELMTKNVFDETKNEFDETKNELDKTKKDLDETNEELDETMLQLKEITMDRNLLMERLNEQSDETNKLLAKQNATINHLRKDRDESQSAFQAENQRLERDIESSFEHNEKLAADIAQLEIDKTTLEGQVSSARDDADELRADNHALRQRVSRLEAANTSTTNRLQQRVSQLRATITSTTAEIPFTSTFQWLTPEDFPVSIRPLLDVLKQEIVSSADWLSRMGYPKMPPILTEHLDKILSTTKSKETLHGRIYNNHTCLLFEAIKYAKNSGKFDEISFPKKIDDAFFQRVVGCTKEVYANKLCQTSLMCKSLCTILLGQRSKTHGLETDHLRSRDYRLQLELSATLEEFLHPFHHTNAFFQFKDTNIMKGSMTVVESRKVFDRQEKFLGWEFRPLRPPGPEDLLTRAKNNEMKKYVDLVSNLAGVVINAGVGYMKENKIFILDYDFHESPLFNKATGELSAALSQSSELTDPPTNNTFSLPQAKLAELSRLGALQTIVGKVWMVNEQGVCSTRPDVKASKYIRNFKDYIAAETLCQYFATKASPNITSRIESITARDQVFFALKGKKTKYIARLDEIINSKLSEWKFFGSIYRKDSADPNSIKAIIYRRRLVVCIIDEFRHGGSNGQISRFVLTNENNTGSREMSYIEVAEQLDSILRNRAARD